MTDDLDPVESIIASHLVTSALVASLIPTLVERGMLSPRDARETYENARLMVEAGQGDDLDVARIYEAAQSAYTISRYVPK
jgi:hypothetical protein